MDKELIDAHVHQFLAQEKPDPEKTISTIIISEREDEEGEPADVIEGEVTPAPNLAHVPLFKRRIPLIWLILCAFLAFVITSLIMVFLVPQFTASATVTIIPTTKKLAISLQIPKINGHIFDPISLSASNKAAATGKGHQNATFASGQVTFYNAAPLMQSIDAGTLLLTGNGIHILTDQIAYIPAANPPLFGQVTVSAHAVMPGSQGNIAAYTINGQCCKEKVFVKNLFSFSGGTDARDFHIVAPADVDSIISSVTPKLIKSIETQAQNLISPDEKLLTPLPCTEKINPDHKVGAEASEVSITVTETCTPLSYNTALFESQVHALIQQEIMHQLGARYQITGALQTAITKVSVQNGVIAVSVASQANTVYFFSQAEKENLTLLIAGKNRDQAIIKLTHIEGVSQAGVKASSDNSTLPQDRGRIRIVVLYSSM